MGGGLAHTPRPGQTGGEDTTVVPREAGICWLPFSSFWGTVVDSPPQVLLQDRGYVSVRTIRFCDNCVECGPTLSDFHCTIMQFVGNGQHLVDVMCVSFAQWLDGSRTAVCPWLTAADLLSAAAGRRSSVFSAMELDMVGHCSNSNGTEYNITHWQVQGSPPSIGTGDFWELASAPQTKGDTTIRHQIMSRELNLPPEAQEAHVNYWFFFCSGNGRAARQGRPAGRTFAGCGSFGLNCAASCPFSCCDTSRILIALEAMIRLRVFVKSGSRDGSKHQKPDPQSLAVCVTIVLKPTRGPSHTSCADPMSQRDWPGTKFCVRPHKATVFFVVDPFPKTYCMSSIWRGVPCLCHPKPDRCRGALSMLAMLVHQHSTALEKGMAQSWPRAFADWWTMTAGAVKRGKGGMPSR